MTIHSPIFLYFVPLSNVSTKLLPTPYKQGLEVSTQLLVLNLGHKPFVRDSPFLIVKEAQPLDLLSEGEVFRKYITL